MNVVIAFGGSLIDFDKDYFQKFKRMIEEISKEHRLFIVVGGGRVAREYIRFAREMNLSEEELDVIGIDATRLNARLISHILKANREIPKTTDEARNVKSKIVVMGGTTPGHSTDAVAAELAEKIDADLLVIATDVDGIYDKDPKKYQDAKLFREISIDKLIEMCGTEWKRAGENVVIDGPALNIAKKSGYDIIVVNGKKLDNLRRAILKEDFIGTKIKRED